MNELRIVIRIKKHTLEFDGQNIVRWTARSRDLFASGNTPQQAVFSLIREYVSRNN